MDDQQRYSVDAFLERTAQQDRGQGLFELETQRMLEVNLNGTIWMKMGAMVAYRGGIKFTREGFLEQGIGNLLKKAVSGEGARLSKAEGTGQLYLADAGKKITVLELKDDAIFVNGSDLLAFEPQLDNKITMMKKIAAMAMGGLFNVRLQGTGLVAVGSHFDPLTLRVTPGSPVRTDPNATVMWSGSLTPELKTDVSMRTLIGRTSGESYQMHFEGDGWVVVQPYEETFLEA